MPNAFLPCSQISVSFDAVSVGKRGGSKFTQLSSLHHLPPAVLWLYQTLPPRLYRLNGGWCCWR